MPLLLQTADTGRAGDLARRRGRNALLLCLLALPASIWLFSSITELWSVIQPLEGAVFMIAATVFGGVLAVVPLAAALGFLLAVWYGVESVYLPRSRPTPLIDRSIVAAGLAVWFAPAIGMLTAALRALAEGRIHFVRPPRDYFLATDPIAFWQGVGFWLTMAAMFGFFAWRYWRGKLGSTRHN